MIPAAIKVTVYFVGLITFDDLASASRRATLLATPPGVTWNGVALVEHHVTIEIDKLTGGKTACEANGATWNGSTCVVKNIPANTAITLPVSSEGFTFGKDFDEVPRLRTFCPGATIDSVTLTSYAAVLPLTSGVLDACGHKDRLVVKLALDEASGDLVIGDKTFKLENDAVVYISNTPPSHGGSSSMRRRMDSLTGSHFFWFYRRLVPPSGGCAYIPEADAYSAPKTCPKYAPLDDARASSGGEFCGPVWP